MPAEPLYAIQWGNLRTLRGSYPVPQMRQQPKGEVRVPINTFHTGGLTPRRQIGQWEEDLDKLSYSEGLWTHIKGGVYLPPLLRVQKDLATTVGYEVLRPNAAGDATALTPSAGNNWDCVDEANIDTADYVRCAHTNGAGDNLTDYYNLTATSLTTETLLGIDVIFFYASSVAAGSSTTFLGGVRRSATDTDGATAISAGGLDGTRLFYKAASLARPGGGTWVVGDLNSLQVKVNITAAAGAATANYDIFQVWVVVRYTPLAANDAIDISGARAANKRVNAINSTLGNTRLAYYPTLDQYLFRETSSSDHALVTAATAGLPTTFTSITGIAELKINNSQMICLGLRSPNGTNSPIYGTTDPTATPVQLEPIGGYVASSYVDGLAFVADVGGGTNLAFGVTAGSSSARISYINTTTAISTNWSTLNDTTLATALPYTPGGTIIGVNPTTTSQVWYLEPIASETTTVLLPRALRYIDCTTVSSVPRATRYTVETQVPHIECACFWLGGVAYAGGETVGPGARVLFYDSSGRVHDLTFPGLNGTTQLLVTSLRSEGPVLIATCSDSGGDGDAIEMMWIDGAWSTYSPLFSKATTNSATIAAHPVSYGQYAGATSQQRRYTFVPSTTTLNVYRIYQPADIFANPILENTGELKHYGALYLETVETAVGGTVEDLKALVKQQAGGRLLSATSGSYGTVRIQTSADGGTSYGADNTFDSAFESYTVASSGLLTRTVKHRITLDNGSTTEANAEAGTPNALPFYSIFVSETPDQYDYMTVIDPGKSGYADTIDLVSAIATEKATNPVRRLQVHGGRGDVPAEVVAFEPVKDGLRVVFRSVPGQTSA